MVLSNTGQVRRHSLVLRDSGVEQFWVTPEPVPDLLKSEPTPGSNDGLTGGTNGPLHQQPLPRGVMEWIYTPLHVAA